MDVDDASRKPAIRDANLQPIGRADGWVRDARTGEPTDLAVRLNAEELTGDLPGDTIVVDGSLVTSIRRDEIVLDRSADQLGRLVQEDCPTARAMAQQKV